MAPLETPGLVNEAIRAWWVNPNMPIVPRVPPVRAVSLCGDRCSANRMSLVTGMFQVLDAVQVD